MLFSCCGLGGRGAQVVGGAPGWAGLLAPVPVPVPVPGSCRSSLVGMAMRGSRVQRVRRAQFSSVVRLWAGTAPRPGTFLAADDDSPLYYEVTFPVVDLHRLTRTAAEAYDLLLGDG